MQPVGPSGNAPFTLSVLDNAFTAVGQTAHEALNEVVELARQADRLGYHRFWMSEHHAMPGASASAPQLMLAQLTEETQQIRLGAGGVMLPNHASLLVAEQFGMLDALAPGRIDLGLGRAPGTDPATATALRRGVDANDAFPEQVVELLNFLGDNFPDGHPYQRVHAVPGPWQAEQNRVPRSSTASEVWLLGTSAHSARLAGRLGRPYAFALQFGDADAASALPPALPRDLPAVPDPRRAAHSHQHRGRGRRRPRRCQATGILLGDGHAAHVPAAALRAPTTRRGRRAPGHGAGTPGARHLHTAVPQRNSVRCSSCPGTPARADRGGRGHARRHGPLAPAQSRTIELLANHYCLPSERS